MMNLRRDVKEAAFCGAVILAVWYVTQVGGLSSALLQTTAAVPVEDRGAVSPKLYTERAEIPQAPVRIASVGNVDIGLSAVIGDALINVDVAVAAEPETAAADDTATAAVDEPIVVAALPDPATTPAPESPLAEAAATEPSDSEPDDVKPAVSKLEITDECLDANVCIDRFLWALYERTPKQDTVKMLERRKVAVKRKGKMVTVTKNVSKRVNQDFTWKDPDAAGRLDMSMMDYVIGGMDRTFKTKLFHTLYAAEQAGMSPGITSAFRDDYRQSIASGMKAATGRSFHGGTMRGGYGHGLAADIVSVDGATRAQRWVSTEKFWKWIDANGKEFGIGRPYLGRDPPHVGPIDGSEYASKRGTNVRLAMAQLKNRGKLAAQASVAKGAKKPNAVQAAGPARATKQGTISNRPKMAMAEPGRS